MQYKCLKTLGQRLSDAVDKVVAGALSYDGEGAFRVLYGELLEDHQLEETCLPLLVDMLGERPENFEFEVVDDEIFLYSGQEMALLDGKPGYKTVDLAATYEDMFAVPYDERITRYWGDYGGHVRKDGVTDAQLREVYDKALEVMGIDSETFQGWTYAGRGAVALYMRSCLLAKTLAAGDEILFLPHCPTGPEGQFQYEIGRLTEVDAFAQNCVVTMEDGEMTVPLRYVLARFDDTMQGNAFGVEGAQPLYYLPETWAVDLLAEVRQAYEQQSAPEMDTDAGEGFGGMTMQ